MEAVRTKKRPNRGAGDALRGSAFVTPAWTLGGAGFEVSRLPSSESLDQNRIRPPNCICQRDRRSLRVNLAVGLSDEMFIPERTPLVSTGLNVVI